MPGKSPTDEELDKMIDKSIDNAKKEDKKEDAKPEKKEHPGKDTKDKPKEKPAKETDKPAAPPIKGEEGYDPWKILHYPHLAEKSMNMVEMENKLVFIVRRNTTKNQIKEAVERGFKVKVLSVKVMITMKGHKKAYIKLAPDYSAADIATRLGMI